MHPELFRLPVFGITVKTYGLFLVVGFLSAVWLAMRRAERVKASPDRVLDVSFLALIFGVAGARLFYVVHYWKSQFADSPNPILAVVDIRQGGLEFLGGLLGAMLAIVIYLLMAKESVRLYLDILAPGAMWGLAFGRLGCYFNGCCFGGACAVAAAGGPQYPWGVQFPYGSPAHQKAWEDRQVTVPAELINTRTMPASLLWPASLSVPIEVREGPKRQVERLEKALADATASDPDAAQVAKIERELQAAKKALQAVRQEHHLDDLEWAQQYPSRESPGRKTSVSELERLAAQCVSPPVHPTQLYSSMHAFLLSGLLSAVFYQRKRHGVVIGLLLLLYPIGRVSLEVIRADNPHDSLGLTVSQLVALGMFVIGAVYLVILYRFMPERSAKKIAD